MTVIAMAVPPAAAGDRQAAAACGHPDAILGPAVLLVVEEALVAARRSFAWAIHAGPGAHAYVGEADAPGAWSHWLVREDRPCVRIGGIDAPSAILYDASVEARVHVIVFSNASDRPATATLAVVAPSVPILACFANPGRAPASRPPPIKPVPPRGPREGAPAPYATPVLPPMK